MRLNRYLALQGITSRREADVLIREGKVLINGKKAWLGDKVTERDKVRLAGPLGKNYAYLAFHKPRGVITHSPQGREKSIADLVRHNPPVFPVGRLDKDSRGLILLTNDGRLTGRLLEPERKHEKEYRVTVDREVTSSFLRRLSEGVELDDGYRTQSCQTAALGDRIFRIVLTEGKKRQIRRMCQALGFFVGDLERIRILNVELGDLKAGQLRKIRGKELSVLLGKLGLEAGTGRKWVKNGIIT